jgi:predicted CopG family antitoxin
MEYLIRDLIEKLTEKKRQELTFIEHYSANNAHGSILLKTGKIIEIENLIKDLEELLQYNSGIK